MNHHGLTITQAIVVLCLWVAFAFAIAMQMLSDRRFLQDAGDQAPDGDEAVHYDTASNAEGAQDHA